MWSIAPRIAFIPLLLALLACGGGSGGDDGIDAEDALSRAQRRFESVKSFHFKLDHENGTTSLAVGLSLGLDEAEGDFQMPDRLKAQAAGKAGPTTLRVDIIAISDRTWITNPFTREFQSVPVSLLHLINPSGLVTAVASSLQDAKIAGSESVDGVNCYKIVGKISSDDLRDGLGFADGGRTLEVEAWIGKDDYLLRRARLRGPLMPSEDDDIARTLTFSKYDAPVTIEQPR